MRNVKKWRFILRVLLCLHLSFSAYRFLQIYHFSFVPLSNYIQPIWVWPSNTKSISQMMNSPTSIVKQRRECSEFELIIFSDFCIFVAFLPSIQFKSFIQNSFVPDNKHFWGIVSNFYFIDPSDFIARFYFLRNWVFHSKSVFNNIAFLYVQKCY
jgi:hypothetical protein